MEYLCVAPCARMGALESNEKNKATGQRLPHFWKKDTKVKNVAEKRQLFREQ